jgi:hypothetical protein
MSVEVWWRNAELYVRDCVELASVKSLLFEPAFLSRKGIDPICLRSCSSPRRFGLP